MLNYLRLLKTKNGLAFFLVNAVAFTGLFLLIDFSIGNIFQWLALKQKTGSEFRTNYSIDKTTADILLFGSSRSEQQYNPQILENRLQLSCYNVGREGLTILYQYPLLKAIIKRYKPKLIILECDNRMFVYNATSYDGLACLLPYYKDNPEIQALIALRTRNEKTKMISNMYPYNSTIFKYLQGIFKMKDNSIKGFTPLQRQLQEPERTVIFNKGQYKLDTTKVQFFKSFIDLCKASGVKLILTSSPYFSMEIGTDTSLAIVQQIADSNYLPFIDLSKGHPLLNKSTFFDDTAHVNITGSKILTNVIADSILQYLPFKI